MTLTPIEFEKALMTEVQRMASEVERLFAEEQDNPMTGEKIRRLLTDISALVGRVNALKEHVYPNGYPEAPSDRDWETISLPQMPYVAPLS